MMARVRSLENGMHLVVLVLAFAPEDKGITVCSFDREDDATKLAQCIVNWQWMAWGWQP